MGIHVWNLAIKRKQGYTLVELLIVITIIGILLVAGLTSYSRQARRARDNKRVADIEQIRSALEIFRTNQGNKSYPASTGGNITMIEAALRLYLSPLPRDPRADGALYNYRGILTGTIKTGYQLCALLEGALPEGGADCPTPNTSCGTGDCNYGVINP